MVAAHSTERIRRPPCTHIPEEELEVRKREKRDVEPPEVRRFLPLGVAEKGGAYLVE